MQVSAPVDIMSKQTDTIGGKPSSFFIPIPKSVITELYTSGISVGTANTVTNPLGELSCARTVFDPSLSECCLHLCVWTSARRSCSRNLEATQLCTQIQTVHQESGRCSVLACGLTRCRASLLHTAVRFDV